MTDITNEISHLKMAILDVYVKYLQPLRSDNSRIIYHTLQYRVVIKIMCVQAEMLTLISTCKAFLIQYIACCGLHMSEISVGGYHLQTSFIDILTKNVDVKQFKKTFKNIVKALQYPIIQ